MMIMLIIFFIIITVIIKSKRVYFQLRNVITINAVLSCTRRCEDVRLID